MIYVTGDTHIPVDIQKFSTKRFPQQKEMNKNDYVIICGDFGGVCDRSNEEKYWIKWLKKKNFTTLFIDGNHENFDMLKYLPVVDFGGDSVHMVDDTIYHLMRGKVYTIDNKKIFTFGGASSHDKKFRIENKNWWQEELPEIYEIEEAEKNLDLVDWNVDYVITHCASNSVQKNLKNHYDENVLTDFFEQLQRKLSYKKWFFGHYHLDKEFDKKHICVFDNIITL